MSAWQFIKHFPCTNLSRHILRVKPRRCFTSSTPPSSFSVTACLSTSSSSESFADAPYLSVRIHCPKHVVDPFSEALLCFGASSVAVDEGDDDEEDEDVTSGSSLASKEICIESIFPVNEEVKMCISQAANSIGLKEIPKFKVEMGDEQDWVSKNQESFQPIEIAERLWIVPEWTSPPVAEGVNIILNPGLAFGTGEHPTTKLCLLLLQSLIKGGEAFLDYGTGSGILAIAALKFGAASSAGVDIDPLAIKSASHNAALNNIPLEKLELHLAPSDNREMPLRKEQFDVVIANILLNPVMELADHILSFAKPGATIGISGILSEQLSSVKERYSPLLEDISVATIGDWVCMGGTKRRS
ncbi:PREDICTED: ribosomal protein L11 methyltransferase [Brassica oleracea var. oleracea]|uniref:ribosomal protein L11 methyltransferase n=1 Tax=Brassica oleracea var. oleracea TaxID=109376 RepID=UPI0006A7570D|nr:PREDICTED: ribosomal protein L11 methyltransferase [Brassica oleracea var. oleracea]